MSGAWLGGCAQTSDGPQPYARWMTETPPVAPPPHPVGGPSHAAEPMFGRSCDLAGLGPLPGDEPGHRRRLPRRVIAYWRLRGALFALLVLGALSVLAWQTDWFTARVRWWLVGVIALLLVVTVMVAPPVRYRIFWYAVS